MRIVTIVVGHLLSGRGSGWAGEGAGLEQPECPQGTGNIKSVGR